MLPGTPQFTATTIYITIIILNTTQTTRLAALTMHQIYRVQKNADQNANITMTPFVLSLGLLS